MNGEDTATGGGEAIGQRASGPCREWRKLGRDAGTFVVPEDFDGPLPEDLLRAFEA